MAAADAVAGVTQTFGVLIAEAEPAMDAASELVAAHVALTTRHGERFRRLEREIEAIFDDPDLEARHLAPLHVIIVAGPRVRAALRSARAMGVI